MSKTFHQKCRWGLVDDPRTNRCPPRCLRSILRPPAVLLCRKRLRHILSGGGCNRAPLLLFSRSLPSPLAHHQHQHQHQHPTSSLDFPVRSSSFVPLLRHVPSRLLRRVPSRLVRLPRLLLVSFVVFPSVRSFAASALDRSTSRPSTLCVVPSKVSTPPAPPRCTVRTHARARHSSFPVVHQRCVLCRPSSPRLRSSYTFPPFEHLRAVLLQWFRV
jgi:hypothetical protein